MVINCSIAIKSRLAVRLESIGAMIVFASALFSVLSIVFTGTVSPSLVGLTITYSLTVTSTLNWMVRMSCEIESQIISVERIKEYIEIEQEAAHETSAEALDAGSYSNWPSRGLIQFNNYSTKYRSGTDLVLNKVSFKALPGEKIGIVGRTGAGKSSLTLGLFRIVEPVEGNIVIDDIDISMLGLQDLRSKLTIIPQDPVLFSGKIRDNLDPFQTKSDNELWLALESASMKEYVSRQEDKLDHIVLQGGENLSVGQRQLMCLARFVFPQVLGNPQGFA